MKYTALNLENKKNNIMINLNFLLLILFISINLTPNLARKVSLNFQIVIMILIFFTSLFGNIKYYINPTKIFLATSSAIIFLCISQILGFSDGAIGNLLNYIIFLFFIIILDYSNVTIKLESKVFLKNYIMWLMSFNIVTNIIELRKNPYLGKAITGATNSFEIAQTSNVGYVTYFVAVVSIALVALYYILSTKTLKKKLKFIFLFLAAVYLVILSGSMITMLTLLSGICIFIFLKVSNDSVFNGILLVIFICSILLSLLLFKDIIYDCLINISFKFDNNMTMLRFQEVAKVITFQSFEDVTLSGRLDLYISSIKTFFENFLFGIGRQHTNVHGVISLHSQILDDLAYYGIFGAVIFINILRMQYKFYYKKRIKNHYNLKCLVVSLVWSFIFYGLFNPFINYTTTIIVFIFIPFIIYSSDKELN